MSTSTKGISSEYQIRVHVIEARDLKGLDSSGQSDPVVFVNAFHQHGKTEVVKKTTAPIWDHLFIWTVNVPPQEWARGRIKLQVFDSNTVLRNVVIGMYEFDIEAIYQMPGHELYRRWVALTDPTDKREGIQGYLKLSISLLAPGDKPIPHEEPEDEDETNAPDTAPGQKVSLQSLILLPPTIATEDHLLVVTVYRAIDLPKLDKLGSIDPYVKVHFAGLHISTEAHSGSQTPKWNEELHIPVTLPTLSDIVTISLFDKDKAKQDELVARMYVRFKDLLDLLGKGASWGPKWLNMYGSPYPSDNPVAQSMNSGDIEASGYRGRLLLDMSVQKIANPKLGKKAAAEPREPPVQPWAVRAEVYEGSELSLGHEEGGTSRGKGGSGDVSLEVCFGNQHVKSKKTAAKDGRAVWYEELPTLSVSLPMDKGFDATQGLGSEGVPDIFVNVYHDQLLSHARVGYHRIKGVPQDQAIRFTALKKDVLGSEQGGFPGFLLYRILSGPKDEIDKIGPSPYANHPPKTHKYSFRAFIYQGRGLPAADDTGVSDPYCSIHLGGKAVRSAVKERTVNPLWFQMLSMELDLPSPLSLCPDINVLVFDKDEVTTDDYLGRFNVSVAEVQEGQEMVDGKLVAKPKWYSLYTRQDETPKQAPSSDEPGAAPYGQILAAFQLFLTDSAPPLPPPQITLPASKECVLRIGLVGLGNILPFQLLSVQHPLVEFDYGVTTDPNAIARIEVKPSPHGGSTLVLETLTLNMKLPIDPIYSPSLNIKVYDNRLGGAHRPLVATGSLDLSKLLPWAKGESRKKKIKLLNSTPAPVVLASGSSTRREDAVTAPPIGVPTALPPVASMSVAGPGADVHINVPEDEGLPLLSDRPRARPVTSDPSPVRTLGDVATSVIPGTEDPSPHDPPEDTEEAAQGGLRPHVAAELEDEYIPPFETLTMYRGKKAGINLFEKLIAKKGQTFFRVGQMKLRLFIEEKGANASPMPSLKDMYAPKPYVLRLYVLKCHSLMPKDRSGSSDPYLVISSKGLGSNTAPSKLIKDTNSVQNRTLNPAYFKFYELPVTLPGDSELSVAVWDADRLGSDELIGETTIDLENRIFSQDWTKLSQKPIEYRDLYHPSSVHSQGQVSMWLDILTPEQAASTPPVPIGPPVQKQYELRAVIWNTKDTAFRDKSMSDIFITAYPEGLKSQNTDTHYRSENGEGMFNWRMVWPITLPLKNPRLKVQLWDKDLLNPNDVIAEATVDLKGFYKRAYKEDGTRRWTIDRQFVSLTHPNYQGVQSKLEMELQLLTAEEARTHPVGLGRGEPNNDPFLAPPDRPDTSFNPFSPWSYLKFVAWRKHRVKVIAALVCCILVVILPVLIGILKVFL